MDPLKCVCVGGGRVLVFDTLFPDTYQVVGTKSPDPIRRSAVSGLGVRFRTKVCIELRFSVRHVLVSFRSRLNVRL